MKTAWTVKQLPHCRHVCQCCLPHASTSTYAMTSNQLFCSLRNITRRHISVMQICFRAKDPFYRSLLHNAMHIPRSNNEHTECNRKKKVSNCRLIEHCDVLCVLPVCVCGGGTRTATINAFNFHKFVFFNLPRHTRPLHSCINMLCVACAWYRPIAQNKNKHKIAHNIQVAHQ